MMTMYVFYRDITFNKPRVEGVVVLVGYLVGRLGVTLCFISFF